MQGKSIVWMIPRSRHDEHAGLVGFYLQCAPQSPYRFRRRWPVAEPTTSPVGTDVASSRQPCGGGSQGSSHLPLDQVLFQAVTQPRVRHFVRQNGSPQSRGSSDIVKQAAAHIYRTIWGGKRIGFGTVDQGELPWILLPEPGGNQAVKHVISNSPERANEGIWDF